MSRDTLSDLLRSVRLRGAVFFYVSLRDQWSAEASTAQEIAEAVVPGCEHAMEYHMIAKGEGWAAVSGLPPVRLAAGDIVMFPQGDRHVISSAPGLAALVQYDFRDNCLNIINYLGLFAGSCGASRRGLLQS